MSITTSNDPRDPVIVAGVRTPFMRSYGAYADQQPYELGRMALSGLASKTGLNLHEIQHLVMGTVIHDPVTSNVARESMLASGYPSTIPANTVTLACISSNVAATQLSDMIKLGRIDVSVFGGTDTCSDPPIRVSKRMRKILVKMSKFKSPTEMLTKLPQLFKGFKFSDISLDVPKVVEFSNGKSMGEGAEILAQQAGISRSDSDKFAERSHLQAVKAQNEGIFKDMIVPVHLPPKFAALEKDDGPRGDTTVEKLAKLGPAFDRKFGICTAGSSSFLTDGASAVLMMSREKAKALGFKAKASIRDYVFSAGDPLTEMLSGPAITVPILLKKNGLTVKDIGVWEIHEAFAAQVLANIKLMNDKDFCKKRLGLDEAMGEIPIDLVNIWGGSLSLGHPFGATGGRLLLTAALRLEREDKRFAVVTGCAAGGHGSAILLERA